MLKDILTTCPICICECFYGYVPDDKRTFKVTCEMCHSLIVYDNTMKPYYLVTDDTIYVFKTLLLQPECLKLLKRTRETVYCFATEGGTMREEVQL